MHIAEGVPALQLPCGRMLCEKGDRCDRHRAHHFAYPEPHLSRQHDLRAWKTGATARENAPRRTRKAAGIVGACFSCGIVADLATLWLHESPTQVLAFLIPLLLTAETIDHLGYDDMCHLRMRAENLNRLWPNANLDRFLACDLFVDRLYFRGHVGVVCRQLHKPHDRPWITDVNNSICEQAWLEIIQINK